MTTPAISANGNTFELDHVDELTALEQLLQAQHFVTRRLSYPTMLPGLSVALRTDRTVEVYVRPRGCALPYVVIDDVGYWSYQKRGDVIGALHELLSNSVGAFKH